VSWFLQKSLTISASHRLPGTGGKCAELHGHTWAITVEVSTEVLGKNGMVVDFHKIATAAGELDHTHLNDTIEQPTAERLAEWVARRIGGVAPHVLGISVSVEESPGSLVTYHTTTADLRREAVHREFAR